MKSILRQLTSRFRSRAGQHGRRLMGSVVLGFGGCDLSPPTSPTLSRALNWNVMAAPSAPLLSSPLTPAPLLGSFSGRPEQLRTRGESLRSAGHHGDKDMGLVGTDKCAVPAGGPGEPPGAHTRIALWGKRP